MVHDSYCCEHFIKTRPFPTQRIGRDFVGMIGILKLYTENFICPVRCRPPENQQWERC